MSWFRERFTTRTLMTLIGLVVIIGGVALAFGFFRNRGSSDQRRSFDFIVPRRDTIVATVNGTGQMQPAQIVNVGFTTPGRVAEVLIAVGDTVRVGDALARLDTRDLAVRVAQAEAQLQQAAASYQKLLAGASAGERAAAEAQVRQAEGQLRQTNGSVTAADVQSAEAQVRQAEEQLRLLTNGPNEADARSVAAQLDQSRAQLATQRDQLSAAKTNAQFQIDQAANTLTQAQSRYATAKRNWEYVQDTGNDPLQPSRGVDARGRNIANRLNNAQRQQYADALVQAEASLKSAEQSVAQAQVAFDTARQNEVTGIQTAEQQVALAQASADKLNAGADAQQLAAARAAVASARASLAKLRGDQRGGALAAAQAAVEQARANAASLNSGAAAPDLASAQAQIRSAQATLELAQLSRDDATLKAPIGGVVAEVNLKVGELPVATKTPVVLTDLSSFYVDVAVDEVDVSRISAGQAVTLTLDALPDLALPASVERVAPLSTTQSAVTAYQVRIAAKASDKRVRPGMSTNADIVVAREENVLVVPRRAVRNDRGRLIVETPNDPAVCALPRDQVQQKPALRQIVVRTGLSNEQVIELVGDFDPRTCLYVEGLDTRFDPIFSRPPGARGN